MDSVVAPSSVPSSSMRYRPVSLFLLIAVLGCHSEFTKSASDESMPESRIPSGVDQYDECDSILELEPGLRLTEPAKSVHESIGHGAPESIDEFEAAVDAVVIFIRSNTKVVCTLDSQADISWIRQW